MKLRLLVLVAALAGSVIAGSLRAQDATGVVLSDETLPLPSFAEYSAGWSVYLRADHIRERQPMPLGLLKACHSSEVVTKQFLEKALLWVQSLPPHFQLFAPETVAKVAANSLWSVRDWKEWNVIYVLQPSIMILFQLPCLAERLFDTKPVVASSGLEIVAGLGNLDRGTMCELCWRHFPNASRGGSRNEVELTYQHLVHETEESRLSHVEGLCWSGSRLARRVLQAREYYLGSGLAIRLDIGFTSDLGGNPTEAETLLSLTWYPTEGTQLRVGYDLFRHRLLHGGTMVW